MTYGHAGHMAAVMAAGRKRNETTLDASVGLAHLAGGPLMCAVSAIGDYGRQRWEPFIQPATGTFFPWVTQDQLEALRLELVELRTLLEEAIRFDEATGQPDCQQEEKIAFLRQFADLLGVDLDEVFG